MHFRINEKPTTDYLSLYNNAGLISKVSEEIASENNENCRCRQPHCCLTRALSHGIHANIRINNKSCWLRLARSRLASGQLNVVTEPEIPVVLRCSTSADDVASESNERSEVEHASWFWSAPETNNHRRRRQGSNYHLHQ